MLIARNTVVTLKYHVKDTDGTSIDEGAAPLVYLHGGYGGIFDRIEEELQGQAVGDSLEDNIEVGMQFERGAEDGESEDGLFTITDIADDKVVVDGNHPLAGIALLFSCTVTDVRAATTEEVSHGHIHGEHGHQH